MRSGKVFTTSKASKIQLGLLKIATDAEETTMRVQ
jgi:hypothetical protein